MREVETALEDCTKRGKKNSKLKKQKRRRKLCMSVGYRCSVHVHCPMSVRAVKINIEKDNSVFFESTIKK